MKIAACYLRVSTDKQTIENQRADVERLALARGFTPQWYEEQESAAKARPVFAAMMADARAGKVSAVVVWALDRLHRSMQGTIADVLELDRVGVQVLSVRESWLDTSGPVRSLLLAIFGWVAEQERNRLRERTRAGLEGARRRGVKLGRKRTSPVRCLMVADEVENGSSLARACEKHGVSPRSYRRWLSRNDNGADSFEPTP